MSRRNLRILLMKWFYEMDIKNDIENISKLNLISIEKKENKEFVKNIITSFSKNHLLIDGKISSSSDSWQINRINKIDLALIRIAITEVLFCGIEKKIVVNEAVEISKEYSTEKSYSFINGVLGKVFEDE